MELSEKTSEDNEPSNQVASEGNSEVGIGMKGDTCVNMIAEASVPMQTAPHDVADDIDEATNRLGARKFAPILLGFPARPPICVEGAFHPPHRPRFFCRTAGLRNTVVFDRNSIE